MEAGQTNGLQNQRVDAGAYLVRKDGSRRGQWFFRLDRRLLRDRITENHPVAAFFFGFIKGLIGESHQGFRRHRSVLAEGSAKGGSYFAEGASGVLQL